MKALRVAVRSADDGDLTLDRHGVPESVRFAPRRQLRLGRPPVVIVVAEHMRDASPRRSDEDRVVPDGDGAAELVARHVPGIERALVVPTRFIVLIVEAEHVRLPGAVPLRTALVGADDDDVFPDRHGTAQTILRLGRILRRQLRGLHRLALRPRGIRCDQDCCRESRDKTRSWE
jgi:hypothetical protein